ncbi:hypothetical protein GCM10010252_26660 [Streptomyces aureoverticillatus]|nr:hypothetical protein GCM10010252_26660 [Streptomyces aureoverticillatus]
MIAAARERSVALLGLGPFWHGPRRAQGLIVGYSRPPRRDVYAALDQIIALVRYGAGLRQGAACAGPRSRW